MHVWRDWILLGLLTLAGCGPVPLESRNVDEVAREAQKMSVPQLRAQARIARDAIRARRAEIESLRQQRVNLGYDRQESPEAKKLDLRMHDVSLHLTNLLPIHKVYIDQLHAKSEDTSDLAP